MTTLNTVTSSTRPSSPTAGDAYFETDTNKIIVWNGSAWTEIIADTPPIFSNTYSLEFQKTNSAYLDIGDISSIAGGQSQFSLSIWFNLPSTTGTHGLFGSNNFWGETFYSAGNISTNGFVVNQAQNITVAITANTWHHLVITFNSGTTKRYFDGSFVGDRSDAGTTTNSATFNGLRLADCDRFNPFSDIKIDEFSVFQSELTASQVTNIYRGETDGGSGGTNRTPGDLSSFQSGNGPDGWWRMGDTGSDFGTNTITDEGGSNDATINNATFSTDVS